MREFSAELFDGGRVLRLLDGDGAVVGEHRLVEGDVDRLVDEVAAAYAQPAPGLLGIGKRLFDWLDNVGDRRLSRELVDARGAGLALRVGVDGNAAAGLRNLPWELAADGKGFLARDRSRPFSVMRRVAGGGDGLVRENRPLRLLFLAASPRGLDPVLDFEAEEADILAVTSRTGVQLVVEERGSLEGLSERLSEVDAGWFDVLHMTGHAGVDPDLGPVLCLEDELGEREDVTAKSLADAVGGRWPRLMFVSGCSTAAPGAGLDPSFAERLIELGAPCVVAWARKVSDRHATAFATELYKQLGSGSSVEEAVARARTELLEAESRAGTALWWHLLRGYTGIGHIGPLVTPLGHADRARLPRRRPADAELLDAKRGSGEVCARKDFVGRRRELQRVLRHLSEVDQSADDYTEGVVVFGMGGLGKSSLAARVCERLAHRRVVWVGEIDEASLRRTLSDELGGEAARVLNEPDESLERRLRRVLEDAEPLLFVFDDFERNVETDPGRGTPLFDGDRARLLAGAQAALAALARAIRVEDSPSRILVTSRYPLAIGEAPAALVHIGLQGLQGADLTKKTRQLPHIAARDEADPLRERAMTVAGGNPRLLHRLDTALATEGLDTEALLAELERVSEDFRESVLARALFDALPDGARRAVGCLTSCALPVDRTAALAIIDGADAGADLDRAVAATLIEATPLPDTGWTYRVAPVVTELAADALPPDDLAAAVHRAFTHLHETWWVLPGGATEQEALELVRLSLAADEAPAGARIADTVTNWWIHASRLRDAAGLAEFVLEETDDPGLRHNLARAQEILGLTSLAIDNYRRALSACAPNDEVERAAILHNLASVLATQGFIQDALSLYQESLDIKEQIGDVRGKAATLHQMADIAARQGDTTRAMTLYQQSLDIDEQTGDVRGKAATLHQMANIAARQGDTTRAMTLYQQSLDIKEQTGDVRGKAATLHGMANIVAKQGDTPRALNLYQESLDIEEQIGNVWGKAATLANMAHIARSAGDTEKAADLNLEALQALVAVRAWDDAIVVLSNLGQSSDSPVEVLVEACWLCVTVDAEALNTVLVVSATARRVATDRVLSTNLAAFAIEHARGLAEHPAQDTIVGAVVAAVAAAVGVDTFDDQAAFDAGVEQVMERAGDLETLRERIRGGLEALVPDGAWMFDRGDVG